MTHELDEWRIRERYELTVVSGVLFTPTMLFAVPFVSGRPLIIAIFSIVLALLVLTAALVLRHRYVGLERIGVLRGLLAVSLPQSLALLLISSYVALEIAGYGLIVILAATYCAVVGAAYAHLNRERRAKTGSANTGVIAAASGVGVVLTPIITLYFGATFIASMVLLLLFVLSLATLLLFIRTFNELSRST